MLSIERIKELLENRDLTDEEAEEIRDAFRALAEIIFEKWQEDKKTKAALHRSKNVRYDEPEGEGPKNNSQS